MGAPITQGGHSETTESEEKTAQGQFKIYAPEMQLILWIRQQRNLLHTGESMRCEIEIDTDFSHIDILNLAQFRRLVLAS